jgi:hypothetical protein
LSSDGRNLSGLTSLPLADLHPYRLLNSTAKINAYGSMTGNTCNRVSILVFDLQRMIFTRFTFALIIIPTRYGGCNPQTHREIKPGRLLIGILTGIFHAEIFIY